jgi:hypothetical protein
LIGVGATGHGDLESLYPLSLGRPEWNSHVFGTSLTADERTGSGQLDGPIRQREGALTRVRDAESSGFLVDEEWDMKRALDLVEADVVASSSSRRGERKPSPASNWPTGPHPRPAL